jgi:hypothetical protein
MNKKHKILALGIVIIIVIIAVRLISTNNNQSNSIASRNQTADNLLSLALKYTKESQLDSALAKLVLIGEMSQDGFKPASYDNAMKLINEIYGFRADQKEESFRAYIAKMTEDDYALLMQNKLENMYYTNPTLNKALIDTLYVHRSNRNRYILDEKIKQAMLDKKETVERAKKEHELNNAQSAIRKAYAEKLRDNYLDQGMDIKVSVYGKNNANIKLTFVLFNDVWTHKMQKGTLIKEIQDMGFKKLSLSDGYEYNVYWDF